MAFVVKKTISGNDYFYLRESKRVNGKVKSITVAYLGKDKTAAEQKAREMQQTKTERDKKEQSEPTTMNESRQEKNQRASEKEFISFIQEAGLIWGPEPELYGGLAGFYTYGPLGKLLKNKVEQSVRSIFNSNGFRELEGPTVLPDEVWKASGHLDTFTDPLILTEDGTESYRADKLLEDQDIQIPSIKPDVLLDLIKKHNITAPNGKKLGNKIEQYSLMMKTRVAGKDASLRPETATVTYLPFLRLYTYFRKKTPFAVYQIGKAYRNEISPRQSVLRGREFTQAEAQLFVDPQEKNNWDQFETITNEQLPIWSARDQETQGEGTNVSLQVMIDKKLVKSKAYAWCLWLAYAQFVRFGIPAEQIRLRQHKDDEKAFYADDAWDVEVNLPHYGWTEVCGVHDRTDYDLTQHAKESGQKLEAIRENGERYVPHVLEIAFGTDRPTYALIDFFYEKKDEAEGKTMFKIPYHMAPIDVSVFPLMKKPQLIALAGTVRDLLQERFVTEYDISGSIGKRYLRSASAGTPFSITIDFDSLEQDDVTIRDRDSEKQVRVKIADLRETIDALLRGEKQFSELV